MKWMVAVAVALAVGLALADDAGAFYARKTLKQLAGSGASGTPSPSIPCGTVTDWPVAAHVNCAPLK